MHRGTVDQPRDRHQPHPTRVALRNVADRSEFVHRMPHMDLTTFFEQLPLGTYRLQMDGTVLRINTAFAQLHGYPDPAAFQRHAGSQLQALYQDPEQWHQLQTLLHSQGRARNFVSRWTCHKTGATLWVKENAHLVCDANQTPLFYEGTVEDVSTERLAVTALREQEAILRSLLQAIPDQVWLKDLYGSYLACNDSYANALGLPVERIIGTVDADHPAAAMAAHYFVADDTVIRKGKPVSYEVDIRAAGKNAYDTYEIIKAPLRNNAGTVLGVVGMARRVPVSRHSTPPVVHDSTPEESHLLGDDWGGWEYDVQGDTAWLRPA